MCGSHRCYVGEAGDLIRAVDIAEEALTHIRELRVSPSDLEIELLCPVAFAYQERGDMVRAAQILTRVRRHLDELASIFHAPVDIAVV